MRIQHNIMAMNAYRNYTNNSSALSKNLEKLSSGYKINRAGDDAAGLAISEKMRAQITGLETAQKNAKDGISLVQTAEGALTEVHDMLNRMVELADQSANGTYDNEVDRDNLQKEMDQLKSEIDRIADSSNFNGIKLLDGSLSSSGSTIGVTMDTTAGKEGVTEQTPEFSVSLEGLQVTASAAGSGSVTLNIGTGSITLKWKASAATKAGATIALSKLTTTDTSLTLGNITYTLAGSAAGGFSFAASSIPSTATELNPAFDVKVSAGTNAKVGGSVNAGTQVISEGRREVKATLGSTSFAITSSMLADKTSFKIGNQTFTIDYSKKGSTATGTTIGVKDLLDDTGTALKSGVESEIASRITNAGASNDTFTIGNNGSELTMQVRSAKSGDYTTKSEIESAISISGGGKDLTLQIGDTSDTYNQLKVSIQDTHVKSLGLSDIKISDQDSAKSAVDAIKKAINTVSSVRGTLGATQNRLDHTINNLSVMTENIQDAESTIRDTDVAEEMMAYTKNNILVQSAQAMLAQANQVPQGVLQLLQ